MGLIFNAGFERQIFREVFLWAKTPTEEIFRPFSRGDTSVNILVPIKIEFEIFNDRPMRCLPCHARAPLASNKNK